MDQDLIAKNWRELIRPRELESDEDGASPTYGRFSFSPDSTRLGPVGLIEGPGKPYFLVCR